MSIISTRNNTPNYSPINYRCSSFNSENIEYNDEFIEKKRKSQSFSFLKNLTPLLSKNASKDFTESDAVFINEDNNYKKALIKNNLNTFSINDLKQNNKISSKINLLNVLSTNKKINQDKIIIDDNLSQKLLQSSLSDQTQFLISNSLQTAPKLNRLGTRLNRHTSLILPNQSRNNKRLLNIRNTISGVETQQNQNFFYKKNLYNWLNSSSELLRNKKFKRINSLSGLHTLFNPLCPIHGHRALIEAYTRDKFIKVIFFYLFLK